MDIKFIEGIFKLSYRTNFMTYCQSYCGDWYALIIMLTAQLLQRLAQRNEELLQAKQEIT